MRKWHRWLSLVFGVFAVWIAVTGVLSQVVPWFVAKPRPAPLPPGFICPETLTCRPRPSGTSLVGTLHRLHSGEAMGPLGVFVLTLAGCAILFFAVSGLWMYLQMWRNRASRSLKPGWFWK